MLQVVRLALSVTITDLHVTGSSSRSTSSPEKGIESAPTDSLEALLAFSIAHGNVNSILDCLHSLPGESALPTNISFTDTYVCTDYRSTELQANALLHKMEDVTVCRL